jgi:D-alanyl-D-alanine carboxypeptidase (penicillin-binding protein 5/6)
VLPPPARVRRTSRALAVGAIVFAAIIVAVVAIAVHRVTETPPPASVTLAPASTFVPVAPAPAVSVPQQGSAAVQASAVHLVGGSASSQLVEQDATHVRAIGSVAKVMTALALLDAKPLRAGESGPIYTMTARDVQLLQQSQAQGGSTAPVAAGETFTERQILLALLLPSGNNIAETIALWVDGSRDAFVAHLNARAAALAMSSTHFADPSGFDDNTVSTADDLVKLGVATLAQPALADIVSTKQAALPDGTVVQNLDSDLAEPGWLGIKTGSTNLAGGCLLFAARRQPTGSSDANDAVTLVGAVLGQPDLAAALTAAKQLVDTGAPQYSALRASTLQPQLTGTVSAPWGASTPVNVGPVTTSSPVVIRAGVPLTLSGSSLSVTPPLDAGASVGTLEAAAGGVLVARWQVVATSPLPGPDWTWLLRNG